MVLAFIATSNILLLTETAQITSARLRHQGNKEKHFTEAVLLIQEWSRIIRYRPRYGGNMP
jgi:hypothetical protein